MPIHRFQSRGLRESSDESGGTEFGCTCAGCKDVADCGVFEAAAAAFGEGGAEGAGDDYVIVVFGEEGFAAARDVGFGGGEVGGYLGEALESWGGFVSLGEGRSWKDSLPEDIVKDRWVDSSWAWSILFEGRRWV